MSVDPNAVSDPTIVASGENNQDTVKYETYRKTLSEVKNAKAKIAEYEAREQEREQAVLAEQGKYKEALDNSVKKQNELKAALEAKEKAFAKRVFTKEIEAVASQFGARKEALEDIVKVGDWSQVEIDENFSINQEQLKATISNLAKSKPFYFTSNAQAPRDVNISGKAPSGKTAEEMSVDEIKAQLRNLK